MATRDYVKRGRSTRKNTRSKKQPAKGGFPVKWALLAILLVGGFGYGLYLLSQTKAPEPAPTTQTQQPVKAKETPKKTLPPQPKEKWTYIEELESKEVKVEAKEQELSTRPYLMQCGAYRSREQANERKAMIAFQGLESQIKANQGEKGTWYRVVLGPYPQKRKAERDRNMLRRAGIEPCAIWYWD